MDRRGASFIHTILNVSFAPIRIGTFYNLDFKSECPFICLSVKNFCA
jgi:hypothetical protein